jgi:catechol 2,3-dioxygenase
MELMTRYGADAVFLASDGYHHHIGANSWQSRGAEREPLEGPGLDAVAIRAEPEIEAEAVETPDGIRIEIAR